MHKYIYLYAINIKYFIILFTTAFTRDYISIIIITTVISECEIIVYNSIIIKRNNAQYISHPIVQVFS